MVLVLTVIELPTQADVAETAAKVADAAGQAIS